MSMHNYSALSLIVTTLLYLIIPQTTEAFSSAKCLGMGGTGVAYPQDALTIALNPSGITDIENRVDTGAFYLKSHGSATIRNSVSPLINGTLHSNKVKNIFNAEFGVSNRIYESECGERNVSVGLAVYNRQFTKTAYSKPFALFGTTPLGLEYIHEVIAPTIAVKLNSWNSLGVSLDINIQRVKLNGAQNFDNPLRSISPGHVTNRGYNYSNGTGCTIGWLCHLHRTLTLGLTYRFNTEMSQAGKYKGFLADHGKFNIPPRIAFGMTFRPTCDWIVSFDIEQIYWKRTRGLKNPNLPNALVSLLGTRNGPGFGSRNQVYYRLGLAYAINDQWTVRAGFRYSHTPIKVKSSILSNVYTLECMENFFTIGATWAWNPSWELTAIIAHGIPKKLKHNNAIPLVLGLGDVTLKEKQKDLYGLSLGWKY